VKAPDATSDEFLDSILPGNGSAIRQLREHIFRVNTRASEVRRILLLGDPGVGKSHIARAICQHHCWLTKRFLKTGKKCTTQNEEEARSKEQVAFRGIDILEQSGEPFADVLVPALEGDIGLSELFGHEKGAFTGAVRAKNGYFGQKQLTHIFLDEIGYASKPLQQRLLQICQSGTFHPLGSEHTLRSEACIIFATNLNLKEAVRENEFQPDLYWRMLNYVISIPSLASRRDEIQEMIKRKIENLKETVLKAISGDSQMQVSAEDMKWAVETYNWPGNVRQLLHCVDRWFLYREARSFRAVVEEFQQYLPPVSTPSYWEFRREALIERFEGRLKEAALNVQKLKSIHEEIVAVWGTTEAQAEHAYLSAVERCQREDPQIIMKAFGSTAPSQRVHLARLRKKHPVR